MDKTHCFYIITTVKPNIRVNRRGAVLPQAWGKTVLLEHILNLLQLTFWLFNRSETCVIHKVYIPQYYRCTIMHRQVMDTKIHNFSLRGAALPQVTLYRPSIYKF